jgi:hypothetical protein
LHTPQASAAHKGFESKLPVLCRYAPWDGWRIELLPQPEGTRSEIPTCERRDEEASAAAAGAAVRGWSAALVAKRVDRSRTLLCTLDRNSVALEAIGEWWRRPSLQHFACEDGVRGRNEGERAA